MILKKNIFTQKGQTLLEVMVAMSIAILIISAVVISIINALNNQQFGINQNQATHLAQEGTDIFRNLAQSNWESFKSYGNSTAPVTRCLPQVNPTPGPAGGCTTLNAGSPLKFIRQVKIELNQCNSGSTDISGKVTTTVSWIDGKCPAGVYCHKTEVASCMFRPYINSTF